MAQLSSTAPYKRRDTAGQLMLDFAEVVPSPELIAPPPSPSEAEPAAPVHETQPPAERISLSESSVAKIDDAPGFKLSAPRAVEVFPDLPDELTQLAASAIDAPLPTHAFMTDSRAVELIERAANEVRPNEVRRVRVRFFPFRATLYSFKMDRTRTAVIKFHVAFRRAGEEVIFQAARLMLCRSRGIRQSLERTDYDRFVRSLPNLEFKLPGARPPKKIAFGSQGMHRQLADSFQRVNETYFSAQMKQPELCWSPVRARRILGSYQERSDRLIVSRVFDSPNVPLFVLDFLMYHELLHKFLGVGRRGDGKRCMHGPDFKELERKFERYAEAQAFLKRL